MHAGSNTKLLMSISFALWCAALTSDAFSQHQDILSPPNILWITSEDNSPFLGCYGDQFATTPHLDQLASKGFLYTHAYANAPVCAPTRNTIITGVYANSGGHENMRSSYRRSEIVRLYPEYLRQAGYYCTNAQKEDFNIDPTQTRAVWDELGKDAHYRNRPKGKPFFAMRAIVLVKGALFWGSKANRNFDGRNSRESLSKAFATSNSIPRTRLS